MDTNKRICKTCGEAKTPDQYYKDSRYPLGDIHCASCRRAKVKQWRINNLEKAKAIQLASRLRNPEASRARAKKWHYDNKEKHLAYMAVRRRVYADQILSGKLKSTFGITLSEYNALLAKQNGGCAICNKTAEQNKKRLAVDHCHKSNKIRGLLCSACNQAIGLFKDQIVLMKSAIKYIRKNTKS